VQLLLDGRYNADPHPGIRHDIHDTTGIHTYAPVHTLPIAYGTSCTQVAIAMSRLVSIVYEYIHTHNTPPSIQGMFSYFPTTRKPAITVTAAIAIAIAVAVAVAVAAAAAAAAAPASDSLTTVWSAHSHYLSVSSWPR
jgi:hypothetical protein